MSYDVRVAGTGIGFDCEPEETVLDATERAGYSIPYSCRKGVCTTCEGDLVRGEVRVRGRGTATGPAKRVLLCQARPLSPLEIAPERITHRGAPVRKALDARVYDIEWPTSDVAVIQLRFAIGTRARFTAGQYLKVFLADGQTRNFSMANPPHANDGARLHVRRIAGGQFSEEVLPRLSRGSVLTVELPYGQFGLDRESDHPVVLVATGTGFAPLRSIVEDQIRRREHRPIHLYWGARRQADLYQADVATRWAARHSWFSFTPVLSRPDRGWTGRTGRVHAAVLADHPDLSRHQVYACGNPDMTSTARDALILGAGLPPDNFSCDAFVFSREPASPAMTAPVTHRQEGTRSPA